MARKYNGLFLMSKFSRKGWVSLGNTLVRVASLSILYGFSILIKMATNKAVEKQHG